MRVGCVGTACVGDGTREVRALGYAEGSAQKRLQGACCKHASDRRVAGVPDPWPPGPGRYGSACVGAARARAEWGRRLSNLCWYVGGAAFCFCCPDVAKVHRLSKRMSCCSLKSPDPPLPDTPLSYVVGALLCGKSKTKRFHPSPIRARPAQAAGI